MRRRGNRDRKSGVRGSLETLCKSLRALGQRITSGQQKPTPFTIQEVLAENRIALFLRLTSAILGVTITLANILTQICKQSTTLTTPQSAPGRSSTGYANLQIVRGNLCVITNAKLCGAKCASYRANGTTAEQGIASEALANSRELCVKVPMQNQWNSSGKLVGRGKNWLEVVFI